MELKKLVEKTQTLADKATRAMSNEDPHGAHIFLDGLDDLLTDELPNIPPAE